MHYGLIKHGRTPSVFRQPVLLGAPKLRALPLQVWASHLKQAKGCLVSGINITAGAGLTAFLYSFLLDAGCMETLSNASSHAIIQPIASERVDNVPACVESI